METIFVSSPKHKGLQIWRGSKLLAKFEPRGDFGIFITSDPKIVEALKKTPEFGKVIKIWEGKGMPHFTRKNIHHGVITSVNDIPSELRERLKEEIKDEEVKIETDKYVRYGELKARVLRKDGSYRGDATAEEIAEYEKLKEEIG